MWSRRCIRRRADSVQRPRWYSALTPNNRTHAGRVDRAHDDLLRPVRPGQQQRPGFHRQPEPDHVQPAAQHRPGVVDAAAGVEETSTASSPRLSRSPNPSRSSKASFFLSSMTPQACRQAAGRPGPAARPPAHAAGGPPGAGSPRRWTCRPRSRRSSATPRATCPSPRLCLSGKIFPLRQRRQEPKVGSRVYVAGRGLAIERPLVIRPGSARLRGYVSYGHSRAGGVATAPPEAASLG